MQGSLSHCIKVADRQTTKNGVGMGMSFDRRWDGWFAAMKTGNYSRCHNGGARCRCSRFRRNLCGQQLAMADQRPPYWQIRRLSVCLSLSGALTPVAASGLFGEKASMRKSEDKKLSFLLHPHVTSFLFARPPPRPRPRGTCLCLPNFFRLSSVFLARLAAKWNG